MNLLEKFDLRIKIFLHRHLDKTSTLNKTYQDTF